MSAPHEDSSRSTTRRITDPRALLILRVLWVILVGFEIVYAVLNIPFTIDPTTDPTHSPTFSIQLEKIGLNQFYNTTNTILIVLSTVFSLLLASLLMWRTRNERVAIIFSFIFVAFASLAFGISPLPIVSHLAPLLGIAALLTTLYTFPDGRFVPYWTGYVYAAAILLLPFLFINITNSYSVIRHPLFISAIVCGISASIYRYRRAQPLQRQQMKWLVVIAVVFFVWLLLDLMAVAIPRIHFSRFLFLIVLDLFVTALLPCVPLVIGLAIFRYRLWDVDLIINRSLVYGTVTVLLAAVFGAIILLVTAVSTTNGTIIGVIVAAVAAGALFNPTRMAVQRFVDQRVYRFRFDQNELAAAKKPAEIKNPGIFTGRKFGEYDVLGVLGRGGMGEVYKGYCEGQFAAIKVLPKHLADQETFVRRFQREAQTLSTLNHPNIVRLFGSGKTDDGVYYLVMEFIHGKHLGEFIKSEQPTDFDKLRSWLNDIVAALDYIHNRGFVHRDLKPSNIMIRAADENSAVLMDFGLVRDDSVGTHITTGAIGTIDYMAPEQIMAAKEVDARADIYALGVVLYELLTGEPPFKGGVGQVMFAHLQQPAPDPRSASAAIPRPMASAVMRAMEKKPEDRFQSASEFAKALAMS